MTLDHICTLRAAIEEARSQRQKVFAYFVDFQKAFDTVTCSRMIKRLHEMHIPDTLIWGVMSLYESLSEGGFDHREVYQNGWTALLG